MNINPANYYRKNKHWKKFLGKTAKVIAVTSLPYSYCLVEFADKARAEFMGVANHELKRGDKVICVLRKLSIPDKSGVIEYGIRLKKI